MFRKFLNRNIFAAALALALLAALLPGNACSPPPPLPATPFTSDYEMSGANLAFFTDNDSIETLLAASPFYAGGQGLPSQKDEAYQDARAEKIEEIKAEAESLAQAVLGTKDRLDDVRSAYLNYLSVTLDAEPRLGPFAADSFAQVESLAAKEILTESEYLGLKTEGMANAYARTFIEYLKVLKAVELGALYLRDSDNLAGYAAVALATLESSVNPAIQKANTQLDEGMKALDSLRGELQPVVASLEKINYGFNQLYTASYYFTLSADEYVTSALRELEAKVDGLTPREGLTKQDIDGIQAYFALFQKWQAQVKQAADSLPKNRLLKVSDFGEAVPGAVYAADTAGNYGKSVKAMSGPLKAEETEKQQSKFGRGWSVVKDAMLGKPAAQTLGLAIDVAGVFGKMSARGYYALWYGELPEDNGVELKKDWETVLENYERNMSGVQTLRTAEEYMKGAEETVGKGAEALVSKIMPDGAAWVAGEVARATAGLVTGFAHGLYKLADQQADAGQMAEGAVELGFSLIGGSKVIIRGSQMAKGLAAEAKAVGKYAVDYVKAARNLAERDLVARNLTAAELKGLTAEVISNARQMANKEAVDLELQKSLQAGAREAKRLLGAASPAWWKNAKETSRQSLKDLSKKNQEALKTLIGEREGKLSSMEFLDNLFGQKAGEVFKYIARNTADWGFGGKPGTTTTPTPTPAAATSPTAKPTVTPPPAGKPDLTVTTVTSVSFNPSSGKAGQTLSVTFTVKNTGKSASGTFSSRVSLAATEWGTDYSLGNFETQSLGPDQSKTVTATTNAIPSSVPGGSYWVTVFVDGFKQVAESDENNNIGRSGTKFTVQGQEAWTGTLTGSGPVSNYVMDGEISFDFTVKISFSGSLVSTYQGSGFAWGNATIEGTATVVRQTLKDYGLKYYPNARMTGGPVSNGGTNVDVRSDYKEIWLLKDVGDITMIFGRYTEPKESVNNPLFKIRGFVLYPESVTPTSITGRWNFGSAEYMASAYSSPSYRFTLTMQ